MEELLMRALMSFRSFVGVLSLTSGIGDTIGAAVPSDFITAREVGAFNRRSESEWLRSLGVIGVPVDVVGSGEKQKW